MVDACGNPMDFVITGGQVHDVKVAPTLIAQNKQALTQNTQTLIADKGYDCDKLRGQIKQTNTTPNIPKRNNSKSKDQHPIDDHLYKLRHLVENAFEKCKRFRAVAARYDKLLVCYQGTVALAFVYQWLELGLLSGLGYAGLISPPHPLTTPTNRSHNSSSPKSSYSLTSLLLLMPLLSRILLMIRSASWLLISITSLIPWRVLS